MNTETTNRPIRKVAAIIGFVALLVLIAWLSITIVKNVPGSFASLASLAESVRSFDYSRVDNASDDEAVKTITENMLVVTSDTNVIESDSNVRLSWTDASAQGSFIFSYECSDGVVMTIVENDGVRNINCGTNYNLGNTNNITLRVISDESRFADINYTLGFIATNETEPSATADAVVTVVNEGVPLTFADATAETDEEEVTAVEEKPSETTPEPETITEESAPTTPTQGQEFVQEFTYTIPVSNPNGRIDLATRFLAVGTITGNTFVVGQLNNEESGAIQFEVKNLGTKTSEKWTYTVSLPSGGMVESPAQDALEPNERAVITIGFPAADVDDFDFVVNIETDNDNTSLNDNFVETVSFEG